MLGSDCIYYPSDAAALAAALRRYVRPDGGVAVTDAVVEAHWAVAEFLSSGASEFLRKLWGLPEIPNY